MSEPAARVFPTLEEASRALADEIARTLREAVAARSRATLVLSGGSTPRRLHEILASEHADLPWRRIHVFWGDERFVPHDCAQSNYRMAHRTLLDRVPIPPENVHPWATELPTAEDAALEFQAELERFFGCSAVAEGPPRFDVVLLGMGADGHIASLFPDSPALAVDNRWAIPTLAPDEPRERITMTLPVLNAARSVHFLVAGAEKREALRCGMGEPAQPQHCPASLVRPTDGTLTWWLDEEAAR